MRLISNADEEHFQTILVAARLGKSGRILTWLSTKYEDELDDPEAGFQYALAMVAVLQADPEDFMKHAGYSEVIETLGDVLYTDPDHWLARYLRIRLRALVPQKHGAYQDYLAGELAKAVDDARELIDLQTKDAPQPYFASAYVLAAQLQVAQERHDAAAEMVNRAAAGAGGPISYPALGALLSEPFVAMYQRAQPELRAPLAAMMKDLFPDQPAIGAILRKTTVG